MFENTDSEAHSIAVWVRDGSGTDVYSANLGFEGSSRKDDTERVENALLYGDSKYDVEFSVMVDGNEIQTETSTLTTDVDGYTFSISDGRTVDVTVERK